VICIPWLLATVLSYLDRFPEFKPVKKMLKQYLPELK